MLYEHFGGSEHPPHSEEPERMMNEERDCTNDLEIRDYSIDWEKTEFKYLTRMRDYGYTSIHLYLIIHDYERTSSGGRGWMVWLHDWFA
jgi:hypothetical protein